MDEIKTSHRIGIPSIGLQSVRLPIIGNRSKQAGDGMLRDLKTHMLGWYDVKRQGCTNDSLAENPVLKNLSNRKVYSYDFNDLILAAGVTKEGDYKALIPAQSLSSSRNIIAKDVNVGDSFPAYSVRISGLQEGNIIELPTGFGLARKDGVYNIVKHTYTEDEDLRYRYVLRSGDYNDLTIEILPLTLDLQLHNFEFGGLSGVGSYLNTITGLSYNDRFEGTFTKHSVTITRIIQTDTPNYVNIDTAKSKIIKFKVTGLPTDGFVVFHRDAAGNYKTKFSNGEHEVVINSNYILTAVGITGVPVNTETNIKIEVLPSFPNSLVFNGVAPTWYINKSNYKLNGNILKGTWLSNTIINITGVISNNNYLYIDDSLFNTNEDVLEVKIPSYKIRIGGLSDGQTISIYNNKRYDNISYFSERIVNATNGTYILSEVNTTIERTKSDYDISYSDFRLSVNKNNEAVSDNVDIKIEFLPNYAAPTTKMYGDIPDIPLNAVKCMMMDFTPFADKKSTWYYSQRMNYNKEFVIASTSTIVGDLTDTSKIIAYQALNTLGTYINGIKNTDKTVLGLLQQRQVVSVNHASPNYKKIVIGRDDILEDPNFVPQMALNSLILFDRELTREEMAYIIEKLMCEDLVTRRKYEMNMADTDPFTLYLDFEYQLPDDVTAYTGGIVGDHIRTHVIKGNIIPSNTGVLVKTTTPGIKTFKEVYKAPSYIPANDLHGVTVDTPLTDLAGTNDQVLTLGVVDGVIGIRKPALSYIKANRCYVLVAYETPDDNNPETGGEAD